MQKNNVDNTVLFQTCQKNCYNFVKKQFFRILFLQNFRFRSKISISPPYSHGKWWVTYAQFCASELDEPTDCQWMEFAEDQDLQFRDSSVTSAQNQGWRVHPSTNASVKWGPKLPAPWSSKTFSYCFMRVGIRFVWLYLYLALTFILIASRCPRHASHIYVFYDTVMFQTFTTSLAHL